MRLTKRFIINSLEGLTLSEPVRYERYYVNGTVRIQKKGEFLEKEILDANNKVISKENVSSKEFNILRDKAKNVIIRDSYLYLLDNRISIKKYYGDYEPLIRVEVKFSSEEELAGYKKETWMGEDITNSSLAFDKDLSKLNKNEFLEEIKKYS